MSRSLRLFVCGNLILLSASSTAVAWNSAGHMIISLVAYDQMDETARAKAVDLLRAHPRFADHFQSYMPREVSRGNAKEQDEWLFAYASTWPDLVRDAKGAVTRQDVKQFSRPWWHFINIPIYLNDEERPQLERQLGTNLRRDLPQDRDDEFMNIIQALKNSARIVHDASAPKDQRSIHLCWILHLVGDSHQPLHSCALFTAHRFRGGDHGGNYLEIEHGWKLHGFWDDQIATEESYKVVRALAGDIGKNRSLAEAGQKAAASLEADQWLDESFDLAKRYVYTKEVLQKVAAREGHSHLGPLDLPASYKSDAETVSERRAIEAGYRMAKAMQNILP